MTSVPADHRGHLRGSPAPSSGASRAGLSPLRTTRPSGRNATSRRGSPQCGQISTSISNARFISSAQLLRVGRRSLRVRATVVPVSPAAAGSVSEPVEPLGDSGPEGFDSGLWLAGSAHRGFLYRCWRFLRERRRPMILHPTPGSAATRAATTRSAAR